MTNTARIYRYRQNDRTRLALTRSDGSTVDLGPAAPDALTQILESPDPIRTVSALASPNAPILDPATLALLPPIEHQEIWAAGVTYLRSKSARMDESDFSASAYDRVYEADRPELFFKALPQKVVGPGDSVGIRKDARWSVPEPELALVFDSNRRLVACTLGNDMSSRDIEGANLLYLPQAKTYDRSCAVGPCLLLGANEAMARTWQIILEISRAGSIAYSGQTMISQMKRSFDELSSFLFRCQRFPHGAVLLTGTGVVPPNDFTLHPGDVVCIRIDAIGVLENTVVEV